MKKLYWAPRGVSRPVLVLISSISLASLAAVEHFRAPRQEPHHAQMLEAARVASAAFKAIAEVRLEAGAIDPDVDPARSGLIGSAMTPVTSDAGVLPAKQTSINPNFAAVVVRMLKQAGVERGDTVGVGCSGSFPAINICVSAAVQALDLRSIILSSASASQWGANDPDFLWLDMERLLHERGILKHRSVAASLGGLNDTAGGMAKEGRRLLEAGVERNGVPLIVVSSARDSIERRMELYRDHAGGSAIAAYINVGGGTTSVGGPVGKRSFRAGLNLRRPHAELDDSVMTRFIDQGVPVIHLVRIEQLAQAYGLPLRPRTTPGPGEGGVYAPVDYNPFMVVGALVLIMVSLYAFRSPLGHRLLDAPPQDREQPYHEPMV